MRMTSQIPLDRRLYGIAQQLLIAMVSGREPEPGPRRDVVSEQDAVDATLLLLAAIQEQLQANRIRTDSARSAEAETWIDLSKLIAGPRRRRDLPSYRQNLPSPGRAP